MSLRRTHFLLNFSVRFFASSIERHWRISSSSVMMALRDCAEVTFRCRCLSHARLTCQTQSQTFALFSPCPLIREENTAQSYHRKPY